MSYPVSFPAGTMHEPSYRMFNKFLSRVYETVRNNDEKFVNYRFHIKQLFDLDFDENSQTFIFRNEAEYTAFLLKWA